MSFQIGDRIKRLEDREIIGGVVLDIQPAATSDENDIAFIAYDEGGSGWWPMDRIVAVQP